MAIWKGNLATGVLLVDHRVQVHQLQILAHGRRETDVLQENLVRRDVADANLDEKLVFRELDFGERLEGLECLKLELLVVLFDDRVLVEVKDVVARPDLSLDLLHLLWHKLLSHVRELFDVVLRGVVESDEHDVEITLHDAEAEAKAELLLRCQLRDHLHVFQLPRQRLLLFQLILLLPLSVQRFELLAVDVHALEDD